MGMHSGEFNAALIGTVYAKRSSYGLPATNTIDETGMLEILVGNLLSRFC